MLIYKILRADEWADLQANGTTNGAPIDIQDGYIHFSTASQAAETAAKHFKDVSGLMLITCSAMDMDEDLKWEISRGGAKFPHLYRDLRLSDVQSHVPLPLKNGIHKFPEGME